MLFTGCLGSLKTQYFSASPRTIHSHETRVTFNSTLYSAVYLEQCWNTFYLMLADASCTATVPRASRDEQYEQTKWWISPATTANKLYVYPMQKLNNSNLQLSILSYKNCIHWLISLSSGLACAARKLAKVAFIFIFSSNSRTVRRLFLCKQMRLERILVLEIKTRKGVSYVLSRIKNTTTNWRISNDIWVGPVAKYKRRMYVPVGKTWDKKLVYLKTINT